MSRSIYNSTWVVFVAMKTELEPGERNKGLISSPLPTCCHMKIGNKQLIVSIVMRIKNKSTNFKSAKLTSTFCFEGVHG